MIDLKVGTRKTLQKTITGEKSALNYGNGSLQNMPATPTLTALMIEASVSAVDLELPEGYLTVGKSLTIIHDNPTLEGTTITIEAILSNIEGSKLFFEINVYDEVGKIGTGKHERCIVNYGSLVSKVNEGCSVIQSKLS